MLGVQLLFTETRDKKLRAQVLALETWVRVPTPPPSASVTLSELPDLSEPQSSHLYNGESITSLTGLLGRVHQTMCVQDHTLGPAFSSLFPFWRLLIPGVWPQRRSSRCKGVWALNSVLGQPAPHRLEGCDALPRHLPIPYPASMPPAGLQLQGLRT